MTYEAARPGTGAGAFSATADWNRESPWVQVHIPDHLTPGLDTGGQGQRKREREREREGHLGLGSHPVECRHQTLKIRPSSKLLLAMSVSLPGSALANNPEIPHKLWPTGSSFNSIRSSMCSCVQPSLPNRQQTSSSF